MQRPRVLDLSPVSVYLISACFADQILGHTLASTDLVPCWCPGRPRDSARLLITGRRSLGSALAEHFAGVGVKWGQKHKNQAAIDTAAAQINSGFVRAGETGIEPAPCGCGACCPSFSYVQGSSRAPWKWAIFLAQSVRKYQNVHRRWDQDWGQTGL